MIHNVWTRCTYISLSLFQHISAQQETLPKVAPSPKPSLGPQPNPNPKNHLTSRFIRLLFCLPRLITHAMLIGGLLGLLRDALVVGLFLCLRGLLGGLLRDTLVVGLPFFLRRLVTRLIFQLLRLVAQISAVRVADVGVGRRAFDRVRVVRVLCRHRAVLGLGRLVVRAAGDFLLNRVHGGSGDFVLVLVLVLVLGKG